MSRWTRASGAWAGIVLATAVALPFVAAQIYTGLSHDPRHPTEATRSADAFVCSLRPWLCDDLRVDALPRWAGVLALELAVCGALLGDIRSPERATLPYYFSFVVSFTLWTVLLDAASFLTLFALTFST
jgi:hypothetical protein